MDNPTNTQLLIDAKQIAGDAKNLVAQYPVYADLELPDAGVQQTHDTQHNKNTNGGS